MMNMPSASVSVYNWNYNYNVEYIYSTFFILLLPLFQSDGVKTDDLRLHGKREDPPLGSKAQTWLISWQIFDFYSIVTMHYNTSS